MLSQFYIQFLSKLQSQLLSLFSELLLSICLELLSLFSQFHLQLLSKNTLKGLKCGLVGISRLLNSLSKLLVDSRRSINRGSTHSSSSGKPNSLRRLRFLHLFLDQPLSWSGNLFGRLLLGCAKWILLIDHYKMVWLRSLGLLLLLLLLSDGGLISRSWSAEVDRLVDLEAYFST